MSGERRTAALKHIRRVRVGLTTEQRVEMLDQLLLLLIDQLAITEVEASINGAVKLAKRRHPTLMRAPDGALVVKS